MFFFSSECSLRWIAVKDLSESIANIIKYLADISLEYSGSQLPKDEQAGKLWENFPLNGKFQRKTNVTFNEANAPFPFFNTS